MSELIKVRNLEWPLKRYGMLAIDSQSEDGYWDGAATSENARGANLAWIDPIDIAIIKDDELIFSKKDILNAFAKALNVPDAEGWATGQDILRALGFIIPAGTEGDK